MPGWVIERLERRHDRAAFDCGIPRLKLWLQRSAGQFDRRDLSRTFALCERGRDRVLAYYALASHRVPFDQLPADEARGLPTIDIPVILLGRLAVDVSLHGQGIGGAILAHALRRCLDVSDHIGIRAVEVDAINEDARNFYLRYSLIPLNDAPNHLFLPISIVRSLSLPPLPP